jgi:AcrR family transcriptional regulator
VKYGAGRDVLIEAAVRVVAERGLRGLTFRAVAESAEVNNSLVAHHFGNRETLLAAALDWSVEQSIQATTLLDFESEKTFVDALLESLRTNLGLQVFQYEMILEARRNPLYRQAVEHLYERYLDAMLVGLHHLGVQGDLAATARYVFASLDGLVLQYLAGVDESTIRSAIASLWRSLGVRDITT